MDFQPLRFIEEFIEVFYQKPPLLEKRPGCPDSFTWHGKEYCIVELLGEWHDYKRRGSMSRNMQPQHAIRAEGRGSWGVGKDYYRVRTSDNHIFDLYFDRSPKDVDHRKGGWFLFRELILKK